ncbi:hypothetical protein ASPWEDRAFT_98518, partial [Aspergillus wentii DTO 134E9]
PEIRDAIDNILCGCSSRFEWAESYDTKISGDSWERLSRIIAPEIEIDYTKVNSINTTMPASSFRTMISGPDFLGDPLIRTQHFIGATKWEKISSTLLEGHHQLRTTHHRFAEPIRGNNSESVVAPVQFKSHVYAKFRYVNMDGGWKWGGLECRIRWNDGPINKLF